MIELGVFTAIITVTNCLLLVIVVFLLPDLFEIPQFILSAAYAVLYCTVIIAVEVALAVFVLCKLRIRRQSVDRRRSADDDFERLVALVALVFCCCLLMNLVDFIFRLHAKNEWDAYASRWNYWSNFAVALNSSVNLIIYLVASHNFRVAFYRLATTVKDFLF